MKLMARPSIKVEQFFKEHAASLQMRLVAGNGGMGRIIREPTVNRPGLALSGFTRYFAYKRVQVFGNAEVYYLRSLPREEREARYANLFACKIPCVVFSRGMRPDKEFLAAAAKAGVPIFQSPLVTMKFINLATLELEMMFAPRAMEIGSMVDILGVGVLIRGDSGMGKSEAVLGADRTRLQPRLGRRDPRDTRGRAQRHGHERRIDAQPHGDPRHRHHQCRLDVRG